MRNRRKQKRQPIIIKKQKELPDPFSVLNPEVESEEELQQYHENVCPCCLDRNDRKIEIELIKKQQEYLKWAQEGKIDGSDQRFHLSRRVPDSS